MSQATDQRESKWQAELSKPNIPPKRRLTFNGLHGLISQKIELFKIADVYRNIQYIAFV
jgi:hypothetical protein